MAFELLNAQAVVIAAAAAHVTVEEARAVFGGPGGEIFDGYGRVGFVHCLVKGGAAGK